MVEAMSQSIGQAEVLVAGGGPAGLAAAIAARQAGLEVTVVDCARLPSTKRAAKASCLTAWRHFANWAFP